MQERMPLLLNTPSCLLPISCILVFNFADFFCIRMASFCAADGSVQTSRQQGRLRVFAKAAYVLALPQLIYP